MNRFVLDAGALIALEQRDQAMWERLARARRDGIALLTHGGVLGQVWRDARQVQLARAMRWLDIRPLDATLGRQVGALLAMTRTTDVIDAAVALIAADGDEIYTSDPGDLLRLADAAERDVAIIPV